MLTHIGFEDPLPCKVCGEPFVDSEFKLCAEHYMEMVGEQEQKHGEHEEI